jgi:hypothetical protein
MYIWAKLALQMNTPYKKQVKTTLKGDLLSKFRFFMHDENMRESEALKYLVVKGLREITYNRNLEVKKK